MGHKFSSTRRLLAVLLFVLFLNQAFSQTTISRQLVDQYPTSAWGHPIYGLTWLPTDYNYNTSQKYPLIIFLHGIGQAGTGIGGLYNLASTGLPLKIAQGWNLEATNPSDGQTYKFIVVSPQAPTWTCEWTQIQYILADVMKRYRVDSDRVYVTGLSAGGQGSFTCVTSGPAAAQKFAAIAPISSANAVPMDSIPLIGKKYGVNMWQVCGDQDAFWSFVSTATQLYNKEAPASPAVATALNGVGHWGWDTAYDPNWRSNSYGLNIYEWLLKSKRGSGTSNTSYAVPTVSAGTNQTISLPTNSISLNGSATLVTGSTTFTFQWSKISGPSCSINNPGQAQTSVSGLVAGTYVFRLTVTSSLGISGSADVTIVVNPAPSAAPVAVSYIPIAGTVEAESFSSMSGVQTEITADAGGGQNVGWIDQGDWMDYNVNPSTSGTYTVNLRIATPNNGGQLQIRKLNGTVLQTVSVANTGGYQNWQTITSTVDLSAGQQTLRIISTAQPLWNINWMQFVAPAPTPAPAPPSSSSVTKVEAEGYTAMQGVQTETTYDAGGGQNVGWINQGDWMDYSINPSTSGSFTVNFRIATEAPDAQFQLRKADGTVLQTITVPNTFGYQTWRTITATVNLSAGAQTIRLYSSGNGGWNINWMEFSFASSSTTSTPPATGTSSTTKVEAEAYSQMQGVRTEPTYDPQGGGQNVGWIDQGDWMDYAVNLPSSGSYTVNFRIATEASAAEFQLKKGDGTLLQTVAVPNTAGYQNWRTISVTVSLTQGAQTLRLLSSGTGGWNINWMELVGPSGGAASPIASATTFKVEAEAYAQMNGVRTEPTYDPQGGGQNVGWIDQNDWMDYAINPTAGTYTVNLRIATEVTGAQLQFRKADGTVLQTVSIPNTAGYQTWRTVSTTITLPGGAQSLRVVSLNQPGCNINWMEFVPVSTTTAAKSTESVEVVEDTDQPASIYPERVEKSFVLTLSSPYKGKVVVELKDDKGQVVKRYQVQKSQTGLQLIHLSAQGVKRGAYSLHILQGNQNTELKVEKL